MFGRHEKTPTAAAANIEVLQDGVDAKEQAEAMLEEIRLESLLTPEGHLWLREDHDQVAAALAVVAYVNDRFAEVLHATAAEQAKDRNKLPEDVVAFGTQSSMVALQKTAEARSYKVNRSYEFDDESRTNLTAENQLPYWPRLAEVSGEYPAWMAPDGAVVSDAFLMGTLAAAKELAGWVHGLRHDAQGGICNNAPQELVDEIEPYFAEQMDEVALCIEVAEGLTHFETDQMVPPSATTAASARELMFTTIHDAFIAAYQVAIAATTPQMLNDDFGTMRSELR